jgi:formylglycine-generating enzyme required for sulfatase activity
MKTFKFLLCLGALVSLAAPLNATAITQAQLSLTMSSGLQISGAVGALYAIDYTTNLAQTNAWRSLTNLTLPASPFLVAGTVPATIGCRFYRAVALTSPTNQASMVFIPPGVFTLGSPSNEVDRYTDEGPQTTVTNSLGFWIGIYPVTQQDYQSVISNNPSYFNGDRSGAPYYDRNYGTDLTRPVEHVTWQDATNYCAVLTQRDLAAGRIPARYQYRLPTEAEWEYACRAGTATRFYYGDDPGYINLPSQAWYFDNSGGQTHPVGQKPPNPWGLYDMCGNVFQWCQDWYGTYPGGGEADPQGPAAGQYRVLRGGCWSYDNWFCRSACRMYDDPADIYDYYNCYGFRLVLAPSGL